jgi:hypothetical protein
VEHDIDFFEFVFRAPLVSNGGCGLDSEEVVVGNTDVLTSSPLVHFYPLCTGRAFHSN